MRNAVRPLTLGGILDESLRLYKQYFGAIFGMSLLVGLVPSLLSELLGAALDNAPEGAVSGITRFFLGIADIEVSFAVSILMDAIVAAGLVQLLERDSIQWGWALGRVLRRLPALLMLNLLIFVPVVLGLCFFVIPGLYLMVIWLFPVTALVIEDCTALDSLSRSVFLMKGARWRGVAFLLVVTLVEIAPMQLLDAILGPRLEIASHVALGVLLSGYWTICTTLFYFSRRCEKEHFDVELAALEVVQAQEAAAQEAEANALL